MKPDAQLAWPDVNSRCPHWLISSHPGLGACQVKYHDKNLQCPYSLFDGTRLSEGLSRLTKWLNMTSNRPNEGKGPSVR